MGHHRPAYYTHKANSYSSTSSTLASTGTSTSSRPSRSSNRKPAAPPLPKINRDHSTRNTCAFFLALAWITGLAALGGGIWILRGQRQRQRDSGEGWWWTQDSPLELSLPEVVKQLTPLALNLWLAVVQDAIGYLHATTLKWALARENRLAFNSNLRLFTSARHSAANAWYANALLFLAMVATYASSSLLLVNAYGAADDAAASEVLDQLTSRLRKMWSVTATPIAVSGTSLATLGAALLAQAFVATAALARARCPTWSSSPFDAVLACREIGAVAPPRPDRCLLGVCDAERPSEPARPRARQRGAWAAHGEVQRVVWLLWAVAGVTLLGGAVPIQVCAARRKMPGVVLMNNANNGGAGAVLLQTAVFAALQAGLTLALHCAELLVNLTRDELAWRRTARGYRLDGHDAVWAAVSSWQAFVLFLAKPAIHWVFGLAVTVEYRWVYLKGVPFFYLAGAAAALAAYVTVLSMWRPKGPQPAAYGHLQTLTDLIDEWSPVLFWGHKVSGPICHAGTSSRPMADIEMDRLYAGETSE